MSFAVADAADGLEVAPMIAAIFVVSNSTVTGVSEIWLTLGCKGREPIMEQVVHDFFARYGRALLDRDADAIADMYAVPSLIAFPGRSIAVSDRTQTRDFFASSWSGYDGVTEAEPHPVTVAETGHSIWVDVTWSYNGAAQERYIYQLLNGPAGWRIGVLTPLAL